ncbi:MAG TPA: hypothetical protein VL463_02475 [Kofleriaceae bacterium]|nr:hypothetical protein [Kofleriaceae bacterium]
MSRVAAILCALVCACTDVENGPAGDPAGTLSEPIFRCSVEPVLVRECSYNGCHGQQSALRVYSPGKLRATPPANIDEAVAPLTEAEHHANFLSAAGFAFGGVAADDNLLVRKPLPSSDGGFSHFGGAIFSGLQDAQYVAIHDWLAGSGKCP